MLRHAWLLGPIALLALACGSGTTDATAGPSSTRCIFGTNRPCPCDAGGLGVQSCLPDGSGFSECKCQLLPGPDAPDDSPASCGDGFCEKTKGETCTDCPSDCGQCAKCDYAPTCTGASTLPLTSSDEPTFSNAGRTDYVSTLADGGVSIDKTNCNAPQLKMRIKDVTLVKAGTGSDIKSAIDMYCIVATSDATTSELLVTPLQHGGNGAGPFPLAPTLATFWGQDSVTTVDGGVPLPSKPKVSQFNVVASYQCFQVDSPDALQAALGAIAGVAGAGAAIPGNPYGWAFGLGGAAAAAVQAALGASNGSHLRLSVQQTIAADTLLELTNGRTWTIQQSGDAGGTCLFTSNCDWDWKLTVEAWGCSTPRGTSPN